MRCALRAVAHALSGALAPVLGRAFAGTPLRAERQLALMSQRTERVDELLRQEIGGIMTREVADPRVGFATITQVETTRDLRHAKVWVSVIGQPAERDATMAALRHAVPFIRHELGRTLRIKRIPDLHLQLDDTAERGTRLLHLLSDIEAGITPDADVPVAESLPTPIGRVPQMDDLAEEPPSAVHKPDPNAKRRYRAGGRSGGGRPTKHGSSR